MSYRTIFGAACAAILALPALAQTAEELPNFPTAAAPPSGDAFPAQKVEFPNGVTATADITYDTQVGYRPMTLDLYRQSDADDPRPLVLYIHGGGWERSHKRAAGVFTDFPGVLAELASRGFVTASAEYRLSGESTFPGPLYDVKAAIRFLRENAEEYGIDPERIAIWGSSAGGHLAALAAVSCDEEVLMPYAAGRTETSACVDAAAIWYGIFDLGPVDEAPEPSMNLNPPLRHLGCYPGQCPEYLINAASPSHFVDGSDPAFFLAHGEDDKIVPVSQSRDFEALLSEAGVSVETHYVPGVDHSFVAEEEATTRQSALEAMVRTFAFFGEQLQP